jgi:hypothetical protein
LHVNPPYLDLRNHQTTMEMPRLYLEIDLVTTICYGMAHTRYSVSVWAGV